MRIVCIGDIHGRDSWKRIVDEETGADKIVFIGDYWDSFNIPFEKQKENFLEISDYKREQGDRVELLIGNHDFHYMALAMLVGEQYSGFQTKYCQEIREIVDWKLEYLTMSFQYENYLFTHAGVSYPWFESWKGRVPNSENMSYCEVVNYLFRNTPQAFLFQGSEPSGDDDTQSPIWIRPSSLFWSGVADFTQIVGHTRQIKGITPAAELSRGGRAIFIDVLENGDYNPLEYLIIEDGKETVGRIQGQRVSK